MNQSRKILGIDVGGTKIAAGLVDKSFHISRVSVLPTSHKDLTKQLLNIIESFNGFDAIGLGMPGQVLPNGLVNRLGNIPNFKPINVKEMLEKKFRVRVSVINDAKAFALAEARIGAGKAFASVAGVILGTGIGVGFVQNGQVYFGANSLAGEIGHMELPNGKFLEEIVRQDGPFKNARQAQKYLRTLMSVVVRSMDPEIIVVGGGWSGLAGMEKELKQIIKTLRKFPVKTLVKVSKLKHAGVIGAALFAIKNQKS